MSPLPGLIAAIAMAPAPPAVVDYTLTPIVEAGALARLDVAIVFSGDPDGETRLELPQEWAGEDRLWTSLGEVTVRGASMSEDGPGVRILRHAPGAAITVSYRVAPSAEEPGADYPKARPIVRPDWFYLHGEGVFARPEGRDAVPASFRWGAIPAGWTVVSDLDHMAAGRPGTVGDIVESASLGAPGLDVVERQVRGAPLRVAVRGRWPFQTSALADLAVRIVETGEDLWRDDGRPYLLTVGPLTGGTGGRISTNGTGRGDAFAVLSTDNVDLTGEAFFLAHEHQHTWISNQVGGLPPDNEALEYWFSEGFTDFYASRVLMRAGVWSLEDYVAGLNAVLVRYGTSPSRAAPAAQILGRFWSDQSLQQLSYDRGRLLATLWDDRLRDRSKGALDLDDVLFAQRDQARADARAGRAVSGGALFPTVFRKVAGVDPGPEIDAHIVRGEVVRLPPALYGGCLTVTTAPLAVFDRGFDGEKSAETGIISGVDPAGPAYAAGLRDGMRRLGREGGREGDSTVEIGYRVADASGAERLIRYRPEGRERPAVQRVAIRTGLGAAARAACAAAISGR